MSWLSKSLGLDKLAKTGDVFGKIVTAANEVEVDIETTVSDGAAAVATIEQILANPANFGTDATQAVADLKAAVAAAQLMITTLKGV